MLPIRVHLLLALSCVASTFAIKGSRVRGGGRLPRYLQAQGPLDATTTKDAVIPDPKGTTMESVPKGTTNTMESVPKGTTNTMDTVPKGTTTKDTTTTMDAVPKGTTSTKDVVPKADPKGEKKSGKGTEKKEKKCKKAKNMPPVQTPLEASDEAPAQAPVEASETMSEEPYCLHGQVTQEECQSAKIGKIPKDHKSVKGNVALGISYAEESSPEQVLSKVEAIFRSETAPEFIGCDSRRRLEAVVSEEDKTTTEVASDVEEELRVTGVDFRELLVSERECKSTEVDVNCDTIQTNVEIFYEGSEVSADDESEMFALLIATIESQAASGSFDGVGTIDGVSTVESVDLGGTGTGTGSTSKGAGEETSEAGIPAGIVAGVVAFVVVVAALVIGFLVTRSRSQSQSQSRADETSFKNEDKTCEDSAEGPAPVVAEAIAVIVDEGENPDWKKSQMEFTLEKYNK